MVNLRKNENLQKHSTFLAYFFQGTSYICISFDKKIHLAAFWPIFRLPTKWQNQNGHSKIVLFEH
jgi:hypothetical protein